MIIPSSHDFFDLMPLSEQTAYGLIFCIKYFTLCFILYADHLIMALSKAIHPPMRDGITASTHFLPKLSDHHTFLSYLISHFPHIDAKEWLQRFKDGLVTDQQGQTLSPESIYQGDQHIFYYRHLHQETIVPFEHYILFENEDLMVVDKPHFLTVSPTGQYVQQTLLTRLKKATGNAFLTPIHRLDRETAGIILISKSPQTRGMYQQLFATRQVQKTYHAIAPLSDAVSFPLEFSAHMQKSDPFYTMQIIQHAPVNSMTYIERIEWNEKWAKYLLKPLTGKQHQLRVHLSSLGIAIKNDRLYPEIRHEDEDFKKPLQLLAKEIEFLDPVTKQMFHFSSNLELLLLEQ